MRLGIDLGTTRTVVAAHDRGNYPVVGFTSDDGDLLLHYPTVSADVGGRLVHGLEAEAAERRGAPALRSWKRLLAAAGQRGRIRVGSVEVTPVELCTGFLTALRRDLLTASNAPGAKGTRDGTIEAVVSVPANAHSTQRFVTLEGFRRAGFQVRAVVNEPSAAGIEYAHRHERTLSARREHVVVYDLGGGTFDVALVHVAPGHHDVVTTGGVGRLGGDDFDDVLVELALAEAGIGAVEPDTRALLCREAQLVKESINPNSRRIVLDLAALGPRAPGKPVVIPIARYFEAVRPLVEQTLAALDPVLGVLGSAWARGGDDEGEADGETAAGGDIAGIYMVGGASGLPVVPRVVRERFGRRVHRSPHPSAATAIGCAIVAAEEAAPTLAERFTRHFGVFREAEAGHEVTFDGIFRKDTPMPRPGEAPLVATRSYRAAHNLGHYRFVESGLLDDAGAPTGDITPHGDVLFPFAPELVGRDELAAEPVSRLGGPGPRVEERYEVDASGVIAVTITDLDRGRRARFVL
ncbi:MAG: Hsp70 family protein [Polyangiaceae bacterium]|nr:Hsp70 family protein [Polyangiaceae bacterium]